nr:hypothetical protein [Streptomyces kasugaensis]
MPAGIPQEEIVRLSESGDTHRAEAVGGELPAADIDPARGGDDADRPGQAVEEKDHRGDGEQPQGGPQLGLLRHPGRGAALAEDGDARNRLGHDEDQEVGEDQRLTTAAAEVRSRPADAVGDQEEGDQQRVEGDTGDQPVAGPAYRLLGGVRPAEQDDLRADAEGDRRYVHPEDGEVADAQETLVPHGDGAHGEGEALQQQSDHQGAIGVLPPTAPHLAQPEHERTVRRERRDDEAQGSGGVPACFPAGAGHSANGLVGVLAQRNREPDSFGRHGDGAVEER